MGNVSSIVGLVLCIVLVSSVILPINAQSEIPSWVRNNAKWWNQDQISDSEFIQSLQYLIENKIITISSSSKINQSNKIPSWIKSSAGLWANGTISDEEFVSGIQYLIGSGVITISSGITNNSAKCDQFTTAAEKETCIEQLEYNTKIKHSIQISTPYNIGPVTFYYVNSESQKADDGKTILTLHFVVQNNSTHEVTMTCLRQDSCNYVLSDGQNSIPYSTNTLVYGSMTLVPNEQKFLDWTFYSLIDSSKTYSFLVKEQWGSGSIPIKIS